MFLRAGASYSLLRRGFRSSAPRWDYSGRQMKGVRVGRPFIDPKASRVQEVIRSNPVNSGWGGAIDM